MILSRKEKIIEIILSFIVCICFFSSAHIYIITKLLNLRVGILNAARHMLDMPGGIWLFGWISAIGLFYFFYKCFFFSIRKRHKVNIYIIILPIYLFYLIIYFPFYFLPFSELTWFFFDLFGFVLSTAYLITELRFFLGSYDKRSINLKKSLLKQKVTTTQKRKLVIELKGARKIQDTILPVFSQENLNDYRTAIFAKLKPAKFVSGDFYTYALLNNSNIFFAVVDISGKGMSAAMFMLRVDTLIKEKLIKYSDCLDTFMFKVNNGLKFNNNMCMFATLCCGVLNADTGILKMCNAGHTQPIIFQNNRYKLLNTFINPMIGAVNNIEYKTEEFTLSKSDRIILYSDGLIDFPIIGKTHYTCEDLINEFNSIKHLHLQSSVEHIMDKIELLQNNRLMDDITLLGLEYL